MAKSGIEPVNTTDTFQAWLNKTNEFVTLVNTDIMTASALGDTTIGNATLTGTFSANTVNVVDILSANTASVLSIRNSGTITNSINAISPISISSVNENMLTLTSPAEYKPQLRLINGSNVRWLVSHNNASTSSAFVIQTEGSVPAQVTVTQAGRVIASEFQGDGSNLTNISAGAVQSLDASKITTGIFDAARIPNLDGSKITTGTVAAARIASLDASKITTGSFDAARIPSLDASKITTGSFDAARIPNLDGSKITTGTVADARLPSTIVRTSRVVIGGTGITVSGNGDLSADRTISATIASQAQAQTGTAADVLMTPQRTIDTINSNAIRGYIVFNGATGAVLKSRNLTLVKSGTGNYSITCATAIRDGTTNWGVVITNIDDGVLTQTPSSVNSSTINNFQANWWNAFSTNLTTTGFTVRAKRTYSQWSDFLVGNDNAGGNSFGITALDPTYIALVVF